MRAGGMARLDGSFRPPDGVRRMRGMLQFSGPLCAVAVFSAHTTEWTWLS